MTLRSVDQLLYGCSTRTAVVPTLQHLNMADYEYGRTKFSNNMYVVGRTQKNTAVRSFTSAGTMVYILITVARSHRHVVTWVFDVQRFAVVKPGSNPGDYIHNFVHICTSTS